jgi:hypothetical protein
MGDPIPHDQLTYYQAITYAINDIAQHGYDSADRVAYWTEIIRRAALRSLKPEAQVEQDIKDVLTAAFIKQIDGGAVLRNNPGVKPFTLQMIKPELHAELSRRIAASADLIKLNRPVAIEKTLRRFQGWATSLPPGKPADVQRQKTKMEVKKALSQLPFEERRVIIDQNAKLVSAINTTVAVNGGAIGGYWQSHKDQRGYNGRPDHNARDGLFFLVRDSWAHADGLVKPNTNGYTDDIEQPAQLPFCKCAWVWRYSLRSVPKECLTKKGEEALQAARAKVASSY